MTEPEEPKPEQWEQAQEPEQEPEEVYEPIIVFDMDNYTEAYYKEKAEQERKKREAEVTNHLMQMEAEIFGEAPTEPGEPQDIDEAINEMREALKNG